MAGAELGRVLSWLNGEEVGTLAFVLSQDEPEVCWGFSDGGSGLGWGLGVGITLVQALFWFCFSASGISVFICKTGPCIFSA